MRLLTFTLAAVCIYLLLRPREGAQQDAGGWMPDLTDINIAPIEAPPVLETIMNTVTSTVRNALEIWRPPAKYAAAIATAEDANGIPRDMLARLLWQESRYRDDIITGRVRSPVGAVGIAQFMPATAAERNLNPLDPIASIAEAGRYLAWLRTRHNSWAEALAAYNWGTGNVARKGLANAPRETRNYYGKILADVNAANGTAWA